MNISQKNHWYGTDEIDRKHHDWLLITFVMIQICSDQDRQRENIKPFNWSKNNKMHTYTFKDEGVGCLKMTPIATCSPGLSWRYSRSNCRERERETVRMQCMCIVLDRISSMGLRNLFSVRQTYMCVGEKKANWIHSIIFFTICHTVKCTQFQKSAVLHWCSESSLFEWLMFEDQIQMGNRQWWYWIDKP